MERPTFPNAAPLANFDIPAPPGRPPSDAEAEEAPHSTPRWLEYPPRHGEVVELRLAEQDSSSPTCPCCPREGLSCDAQGETPRAREVRMLRPIRHPNDASWFPESIVSCSTPRSTPPRDVSSNDVCSDTPPPYREILFRECGGRWNQTQRGFLAVLKVLKLHIRTTRGCVFARHVRYIRR